MTSSWELTWPLKVFSWTPGKVLGRSFLVLVVLVWSSQRWTMRLLLKSLRLALRALNAMVIGLRHLTASWSTRLTLKGWKSRSWPARTWLSSILAHAALKLTRLEHRIDPTKHEKE